MLQPLCLSAQKTKYSAAEKGAIVGNNIGRYNNRPLYINNSNAFILTGDLPVTRLVKDQFLFSTFMIAVERNGLSKWVQDCDQIMSSYYPGKMSWEIGDSALPGLKILLEILPMAATTGMAVRVSAVESERGDYLIWTLGGAVHRPGENLSWKFDAMGQPGILTWEFDPSESKNNFIENEGQTWFVSLMDSTSHKRRSTVSAICNATSTVKTGDASEWGNALQLLNSQSANLPVVTGKASLERGNPVLWAIEVFEEKQLRDLSGFNNPGRAFAEGQKRAESLRNRVKINTPDPYLNSVAQASVAAVDGTWYPPVFHHGAMQWNVRFPGWRTIFGGTMYGWHDRVQAEAKFYIDAQIKESGKNEAKADPELLLTGQHADSRFYGVGRINLDQNFYDMQTQFFDQIIEEYRWTGDPDLIGYLRGALELHLVWIRDCFDPDGDGVYESYINSWPSDSQWYNGGGSAEETSYAYRGHLAARDMARNACDEEAMKYHQRMLEKIKNGFFEKLWIHGQGHSGAYREQSGHERLHENPWLYSIFLPIDAGLTSPLQASESVYYSEWALQNDKMPAGGRRVWTSNWTPGIRSVRELWPGDNYHLALSYFQAGLPDDGWDIMRGTFMHSAFDDLVPGNLGSSQGGIDFGDCVHTFARTLVSGLFGFNPDYPNGKVRICPQFPTEWTNASIELPDVKIAFSRYGSNINYTFELVRAANLELLLPVQCHDIENVMVNNEKVPWKLLPGFGRSILQIELSSCLKAEVVVEVRNPLPYYAPVFLEGKILDPIRLNAKDAYFIQIEDPQEVLENEKTEQDVLLANLTANTGYHSVTALVMAGKAPQWRIFRIKVNDPEGELRQKNRFVQSIPGNASWKTIDISSKLNADVTTIYHQKYLAPRPNTVSVRLGIDGYSPWTFPYWKSIPPEIKMDQLDGLLDDGDRLNTNQGVPFSWNHGAKNIAFTSLWDNYPVKIDFPVNKSGVTVFFLVSGSTNVMQCQIANAVIRLNYADGKTDSLELVPPVNYWNLSTIDSHATAPGQANRIDYTAETDKFCLPAILPETVQLGKNCRAMLLNLKLMPGLELKCITLEALSQEVVVGIMGITIMTD